MRDFVSISYGSCNAYISDTVPTAPDRSNIKLAVTRCSFSRRRRHRRPAVLLPKNVRDVQICNVLLNKRMFAIGPKSAGCNGQVFFRNMRTACCTTTRAVHPEVKTLLCNASNTRKNFSGAFLSSSAVKPSSPPHFPVFSRRTAKRRSAKSHPGSVKRIGPCNG